VPNPYDDLAGKIALVTGANGGMGSSISCALADAGMHVYASDVQETGGADLAGRSDIDYLRCDVSSEEQIVALVDQASVQTGGIDCAVNAAAIEFELCRLADCETTDFDRLMAINLRGLFLCMKYELRAMLRNGSGSIVNLASTTSQKVGRLQPAYTTSKHGVLGLTRQAAMDYAGDNIRINAIAPGNIDTPMLRSAIERRGIKPELVGASMPMGRFGTPDEIAQAALWLCSSGSSFTTGHMLPVEGGLLTT
jgi:NAD(P)-dependent dehydrogenase (short-subunit alcohol dehydrogenase family)